MGKHAYIFLVLPPLGKLDSKVIWHKVWCRNSGILIDRWYFTDERVHNGSVPWKLRACRYTPWLVLGLMVRHLLVHKCTGAVFGMLRLLKAFCWLVTFCMWCSERISLGGLLSCEWFMTPFKIAFTKGFTFPCFYHARKHLKCPLKAESGLYETPNLLSSIPLSWSENLLLIKLPVSGFRCHSIADRRHWILIFSVPMMEWH